MPDEFEAAPTELPPGADEVGPGASIPELDPKFEVLGTLGSGGMGVVLEARHRAMDRVRAVKLLNACYRGHPEVLARFRREATIASDLSHPNIVTVYDFDFTADGTPYISMERLEGEDLEALAAREAPVSVERAVALLEGPADALDRVHELGVVHRDIKPANLFVTTTGLVKVLDFGISHAESANAGLTRDGQVLGTPVYMAPEQLQGLPVSPRTDVYALATVAYELLTGERAVGATTPMALLHELTSKTPVSAMEINPGLSAATSAVLARGLARAPEARFSTASELVAALAGDPPGHASTVLAMHGQHPMSTTEAAIIASPRRRFSVAAVAIVVMALLGAAYVQTAERDAAAPLASVGAPANVVAILPPIVDSSLEDRAWVRQATAARTEQLLSLDARLALASRDEVARHLSAARPGGGEEQDPSRAGPQIFEGLPHDLAERVGASVALLPTVTQGDGRLIVRLVARDLATGDTLFNRAFEGQGLDDALEQATYAFAEEVAAGVEYPPVTPALAARCGVSSEVCHAIVALEQAVVVQGSPRRASRLARSLGMAPEAALWVRAADLSMCLMRAAPEECLDAFDLPPPPPLLSPDRKLLWRALSSSRQVVSSQQLQRLARSEDALVRTLAQNLSRGGTDEEATRLACQRTDTHLDRFNCLNFSASSDEASITLTYYRRMAEKDWVPPNVMAGFATLPLSRDLAYAQKALERARIRGGDHNPYVANALSLLYTALFRPSEAIVWGRRSPHPEVREGTAMQLQGRIVSGYRNALRGTRDLLESFDHLPPSTISQIVRPSVAPAVILRSSVLAAVWLEVMGPLGEKDAALAGATRVLLAVHEATPLPCDDHHPSLEGLQVELLHLCRDPSALIAEARRRDEVGFEERSSRFYVADALLSLGHEKQARSLFTAIDGDAGLRGKQPVTVMITQERLARLDELEGDATQARARYQRLVDLWGRADVEVPEVAAARTRLASLPSSKP